MPRQEERRSQRTKIDRLTYIELPSGNGGILKDISESGLGFCAVAPLDATTSIPVTIRISLSGVLKRVRATGDLVWTDESRKCGGLRFTELPDESRAEIRRWRFESAAPAEGKEQPVVSRPAPVLCPTPPIFVVEPKSAPKEHSNSAPLEFPRLPHPVAAPAATATAGTLIRLRKPSVLIAAVAVLAGTFGFMSNTWYSEIRSHFASKAANRPEQATAFARVAVSSEAPARATPPPPTISVPPAHSAFAFTDDAAAEDRPFDTAKAPAATAAPATAAASVAAKPGSGIRAGADPFDPVDRPEAGHTAAAGSDAQFFFVQVGSYSKQTEAQSLVEKLRQEKFIGYASELGGTKLYRVQLGPYTTDEAADLTQDALQKAGFDSYVRESGSSN